MGPFSGHCMQAGATLSWGSSTTSSRRVHLCGRRPVLWCLRCALAQGQCLSLSRAGTQPVSPQPATVQQALAAAAGYSLWPSTRPVLGGQLVSGSLAHLVDQPTGRRLLLPLAMARSVCWRCRPALCKHPGRSGLGGGGCWSRASSGKVLLAVQTVSPRDIWTISLAGLESLASAVLRSTLLRLLTWQAWSWVYLLA